MSDDSFGKKKKKYTHVPIIIIFFFFEVFKSIDPQRWLTQGQKPITSSEHLIVRFFWKTKPKNTGTVKITLFYENNYPANHLSIVFRINFSLFFFFPINFVYFYFFTTYNTEQLLLIVWFSKLFNKRVTNINKKKNKKLFWPKLNEWNNYTLLCKMCVILYF